MVQWINPNVLLFFADEPSRTAQDKLEHLHVESKNNERKFSTHNTNDRLRLGTLSFLLLININCETFILIETMKLTKIVILPKLTINNVVIKDFISTYLSRNDIYEVFLTVFSSTFIHFCILSVLKFYQTKRSCKKMYFLIIKAKQNFF